MNKTSYLTQVVLQGSSGRQERMRIWKWEKVWRKDPDADDLQGDILAGFQIITFLKDTRSKEVI